MIRDFFAKGVSGSTPDMKLSDLKRRYFISKIGGTNKDSLVDMEKQWLRSVIVAGGGTPSGSLSNLWKQAVMVSGLRVSNSVDENQNTFYSNVTP
jgi:hypothetical protein